MMNTKGKLPKQKKNYAVQVVQKIRHYLLALASRPISTVKFFAVILSKKRGKTIQLRPIRAALALFLLIGLMGCSNDNGGTEPPKEVAEGRFEASIDGGEITFEGSAGFAVDEEGKAFNIWLIKDDFTHRIQFLRSKASRPATGTHEIVEYFKGLMNEAPETKFWGTYQTFGSLSGTLTITSSSTNRLVGTIEFTCGAGDEIHTVSATFEAVCNGTDQDCGG